MSKLQFTTESGSVYLIHDGHLTRQIEGSGILRRDGEPIEIIESYDVEVGKSARFMLNLREDGIPTYRMTTPITDIKELI